MRVFFEAILLTACCVVAGVASAAELSCERATNEALTLRQAPSGARRVDKHVLQLTTKKGPLRYEDSAPHEALSGLHWRYCGYDKRARVHLIEMQKDSLFSGVLLSEETGRTLDAGHTVSFSPDRRAYLAIEQRDGVDGESWSLRDAQGKVAWTGYAGTVQRIDGIDTVASSFEKPRWNARSELTARVVCADSKAKGTIVLRRSGRGWDWEGREKCER